MHVTYSGHFVLLFCQSADYYWHTKTLQHLLSIYAYQIIKPLDLNAVCSSLPLFVVK